MRRLLAGTLVLGATTVGALPAQAAAPRQAQPPAVQVQAAVAAYQQAQQDLLASRASLLRVEQQVTAAGGEVTAAERRTAEDRARVDGLRRQIGEIARSVYQTRGSQLSQVLEARSVAEVWDVLAEARVVSERQHTLLDQLEQIRRTDEALRDQAKARRDSLVAQRDQTVTRIHDLEGRVGALAQSVTAAGRVLAGSATGRVPASRLPQTTGADGQCTWYAEQAWVTYSDPGSPPLTGDGADVVPNLARALGRAAETEPQPGGLVSWQRPLLSTYGHVAFVATVDRDGGGRVTAYTVWEMNYQGPFQTDSRYVPWTGPSSQVLFIGPPQPVDPVLAQLKLFGGG